MPKTTLPKTKSSVTRTTQPRTAKKVNINVYPPTKKYLSLYFHAHQPYRISTFSIFDIGKDKYYFAGPIDQANEYIMQRVAEKNYRPATELLRELTQTSGLKVSFSLSGVLLEQLQEFAPDVIDIYRNLLSTGKAELIAETYYHSLAFFYNKAEFVRQVEKHMHTVKSLFGVKPQIFRNTELTYRNDVGEFVRNMGFKGIFAEGWDPILNGRSPNYLYNAFPAPLPTEEVTIANPKAQKRADNIKLILKNYRLSDDIAFRFQLKGWEGYPVTADKFAHWVTQTPGDIVNLCMDYETIGEHHHADSGIFEFYRYLPGELAKAGVEFVTPSEAVELLPAVDSVDYPHIVSWADQERDLSAWMGNSLQQKSLESIYKLSPVVDERLKAIKTKLEKEELLEVWGKLQTSDHFYYMSTKYWTLRSIRNLPKCPPRLPPGVSKTW
jgi:alpha-amylase